MLKYELKTNDWLQEEYGYEDRRFHTPLGRMGIVDGQ
jgi:hypothetical protein